jgi:hypothetical protein
MDAFRYKKNNYPSNCNRSLFIYFFQFDLGCMHLVVRELKISYPGKGAVWKLTTAAAAPTMTASRTNINTF